MTEIDPSKVLGSLGTSVVMVSVAVGETRNVMTAVRAAVISPKPVLVAVSVAKRRYSHDLIKEAGEFVLAVASSEQRELAHSVGRVSGRDGDKFSRCSVTTLPAVQVKSPLIAGALSNMECRLVETVEAGDFTVFIGEVVVLHVDENAKPLLRFRGKYHELGREL